MVKQKIFAPAGMIGSALFVMIFTIEGWIRHGYDPFSMFISELSLGTRGGIQITNFLVFGSLLMAFTVGAVFPAFKEKKASKTGPVLLAIIAAGYFFSGIFVTDPGTIFAGQKSGHGIIHGIFGGVVFTLMPISCFVFWRHFRSVPGWRSLRGWTLLAGIIIAAAVVVQTLTTKLPAMQPVFSKWFGLVQRLVIIPFMAWLFAFSFLLSKQRRIAHSS